MTFPVGTNFHILIIAALCLASSAMPSAFADDDAVRVSAKQLSALQVNQQKVAPATVISANHAQVAAQVSAEIVSINADVGSQLKKGDLLAKLDNKDYTLALEQARALLKSIDAQIRQASDRLKRAQELSGSQYISADDLLARQTDVMVLNANRTAQEVAIKIAKNNVAKTRITSPFDAVVTARAAQTGSYVVPGTLMFDIVQLENREVEARVSSDLIDSLQSAQQLSFARNTTEWPLELDRVTPVIESDSGIQRVRLKFTDGVTTIGSSGKLRWSGSARYLPADLILQRDGELGVFIADGGVARFHRLPKAQEGRPAVIDLPANTLVITNGRFRLQDGQRIDLSE